MKYTAFVGLVLLAPGIPTLAQSLPSMPTLPGSGSSATKLPSIPGTSASTEKPNTLERAKTEITCKIPSNMSKPECIALMLKK